MSLVLVCYKHALLSKKTGVLCLSSLIYQREKTKARLVSKDFLPENGSGVTLWHFTKQEGVGFARGCAYGNSGHCCGEAVDLG